jgi:hypothetical protein
MMFPSVAPTVALYSKLTKSRSLVQPLVFTAGYLLVWSAVGAAAFVVGLGAPYAATKAWQQLPDGFREAADEVVAESWDGVKDDVVDVWDTTEDLADDLGDSLVAWAAR